LSRSKLSEAQKRELSAALRVRRRLLQKLRGLSVKLLAAKYRVSVQRIYVLDEDLHGVHLPDPACRWLNRRVETKSAGAAG
jgi:hypothetical protein